MLDHLRHIIRATTLADETELLSGLMAACALDADARVRIADHAARLVRDVRQHSDASLMASFLVEYGLSTDEGVALMCLAEALLRVPDAETIDDLIADKVTASDWDAHNGKASSSLVNASTWALMLTGRVLSEREDAGIAAKLHGLVRRVGEPVVRAAVAQSMRELGRQFVLGETIEDALTEGAEMVSEGYTYSYDMLGEGARTDADARRYHLAYADAITEIAQSASDIVRDNPGISVKLSALHPRYEDTQAPLMLDTLVARIRSLAVLAAGSNLGLNIDAEEADRLDVSLDVIQTVLAEPALADWQGFGVVVQAYSRRAAAVIDWLSALSERLDRRIMVRLVKGAYWDTEIKHAQTIGLAGFPVFTRKAATDVSYIACARKLLGMRRRIYPQFATHNAHTVAAVLHLADSTGAQVARDFEFQRLHGMGEALHHQVKQSAGSRCRIYAPVGTHKDLLAYLVRRLLENGANSSFVHQINDPDVAAETIAADPFATLSEHVSWANPHITAPPALFPGRKNSRGWNLSNVVDRSALDDARNPFRDRFWCAQATISTSHIPARAYRSLNELPSDESTITIPEPANPDNVVGKVVPATPEQVEAAITLVSGFTTQWQQTSVSSRGDILRAAALAFENTTGELLALLTREAGKTLADGISEIREAVDFLRYYAQTAESGQSSDSQSMSACGVFACISPWNFPLAIFTGQIAAALVTGNTVVAKPAEQTPLVAARAVALLHSAGVPVGALQLLPGNGPDVGAPITRDPRINGVCFTGSTDTARTIHLNMAKHLHPNAPLIAETGGLNAMIVDSTALPEQAVRDIIASSFVSAGQRCSALRILYLQKDVAPAFLKMLTGAMDALAVGDPWLVTTDVGPLIDDDACNDIRGYLKAAKISHQRVLKASDRIANTARFVPPTLIPIDSINHLEREVFGPVLHVATFKAGDFEQVVSDINSKGFGLTFAVHTRLDDRVQYLADHLKVGNVYVNRNQIGAVVGSQPFGGEGLSGTGPKAGGPHYLLRFQSSKASTTPTTPTAQPAASASLNHAESEESTPQPVMELADAVASLKPQTLSQWRQRNDRSECLAAVAGNHPALTVAALLSERTELPGPTGERNVLQVHPRGIALCLGPSANEAISQALTALALGNGVLIWCEAISAVLRIITELQNIGAPVATICLPDLRALSSVPGIAVVACAGPITSTSGTNPQSTALPITLPTTLKEMRCALAERAGPIVPLVVDTANPIAYVVERHVCTDTTAAGGNAALLATAE